MKIVNFYLKNRRVFEHAQRASLEASYFII